MPLARAASPHGAVDVVLAIRDLRLAFRGLRGPIEVLHGVSLHVRRGETVDLHTPAFRGSPGWPAGRPEIEAKAATLLGKPAAGRLFSAVGALGDGDRFDPARLAAAVRAVSS